MLKVRNAELGSKTPKIIVPVTGKTQDEIISQAQDIVNLKAADLVEWRADYFIFNAQNAAGAEFNVQNLQAELLNTLKILREILAETPLIFTIRTKSEGGEIDINPDDYADLNLKTAGSGLADIIDIEIIGDFENLIKLINLIKNSGCLVIGSKHDFKCTPSRDEIIKILLKAQDAGADILKIAVMPDNKNDVINLIMASAEFNEKYTSKPVIAISMGKLGILSRIACEISGSCATFGAVGKVSAPGQISAVELRTILNALKF